LKESFASGPERHSIGPGTREWILDARACPILRSHGISVLGVSAAAAGFQFVRRKPAMDVLMACTRGRGHALVDGKIEDFHAGMAYLMPARAAHAYGSAGRGIWRVCWLCFTADARQGSIIRTPQPLLVPGETVPLEEAVLGLMREAQGANDPALQKALLALVHLHCLRLARETQPPDRLQHLWAALEEDPARPWRLEELARRAGMSVEALRLQCHRSTGRSPMRQVAFLRLQRAAGALATTRDKMATIAEAVGYQDAFAFSVAFKRHFGVAPSVYRQREGSASIH
jgi:AraC-like DNA-binding protein